MKFHRAERVIYTKNPLIEVICEIRFPLQLEIQDSLPIDFQKEITSEFPLLELKNEIQVQISFDGQPSDPNRGQALKGTQATNYSFSSIDKQWVVTLAAHSIRLSSMAYGSWEDFESKLRLVLGALKQNYSIGYFTKLALRYRDLIDRKALGCEDRQWRDLISERVLGPLNGYGINEADCSDFQQNVSVRLDTGSVNIANGFVVHVKDGHTAFVIDADFQLEQTIKAEENHVIELLRGFNVQAGALFRASISDELHTLLQPSPIK